MKCVTTTETTWQDVKEGVSKNHPNLCVFNNGPPQKGAKKNLIMTEALPAKFALEWLVQRRAIAIASL
jgi:hypothetical protein